MNLSEGVVVALIGGGALVGVAVVTSILAPLVLSRLKAIQAQVANDHKHPDGTPINLRDDLDGKHDENTEKLDRLMSLMAPLERDVRWLMRRVADQDDRLDGVEDSLRTKGQTT